MNKDLRLIITLALGVIVFSFVILFGFTSVDQKKRKQTLSTRENVFGRLIISLGLGEKESLEARVILAGDVMLGRTVMTKSMDLGDPAYPFREVADHLQLADIVFVNLENPIIENCPRHTTGLKFCADPMMVEGLTFSGVDVVTLANNHSGNYGKEGFEETKKYLASNGIDSTGYGNLVIKNKGKTTFGFLGFDLLTNSLNAEYLDLINESDKIVDVLIVGVHWGAEYTAKPSKLQREWAVQMVEAGADVISGHHPHWVQNIEYINNKPVFYSLGNFVFDQMWSEKTKTGMVAELTFVDGELIDTKTLEVYMQNWAQPMWVE